MIFRPEYLPGNIKDMIDVIGLEATEALVIERGGIRLYVPKTVDPSHWIARLIGVDKMALLVARYGGDEIDMPRCEAAMRAAREHEIINSAESNATLARRYGYTERGLRKLKRRVENQQDNPQTDLFEIK